MKADCISSFYAPYPYVFPLFFLIFPPPPSPPYYFLKPMHFSAVNYVPYIVEYLPLAVYWFVVSALNNLLCFLVGQGLSGLLYFYFKFRIDRISMMPEIRKNLDTVYLFKRNREREREKERKYRERQ